MNPNLKSPRRSYLAALLGINLVPECHIVENPPSAGASECHTVENPPSVDRVSKKAAAKAAKAAENAEFEAIISELQKLRDEVGKETTVKNIVLNFVNVHFSAKKCREQWIALFEKIRALLAKGYLVCVVGDENAIPRMNEDGTISILHKEDKNPDGTAIEMWRSPADCRVVLGSSPYSTTKKVRGGAGQMNKYGKKSEGSIDFGIYFIPPDCNVTVRTQVFIGTGAPGEIREIFDTECTTVPGFPSDHALVTNTVTIDGVEQQIIATWNICGESGDGGFNWAEFVPEPFVPHLGRYKEILAALPPIELWKDGELQTIPAAKLIKDKIIPHVNGLRKYEFQNVQLGLPSDDEASQIFAAKCFDEHRKGFQVLLDERAKQLNCMEGLWGFPIWPGRNPGWQEADNRVRMAHYLDEVHRRLFSDPVLKSLYRDLFIQKAREYAGRDSAQPFHFIRRALEERNIDIFCLQEVTHSTLETLESDSWICENYDITTSHDDLSDRTDVKTFGVILTRKPTPTAGAEPSG